jgi:AcrR family transcriptional regulator
MATERLHPDDWARAALAAIDSGGIGAVSVEALGPIVGASKGSFYWHFADRAALVVAALTMWEETRTDAVIRELEPISDPRERLRRLFDTAFDDPGAGRIESSLLSERDDPAIKNVLVRVTKRRAAFMTKAFNELGFDKRQAGFRTIAAYSAYLGLYSIPQSLPGALPARGRTRSSYLNDLLDMLIAQ